MTSHLYRCLYKQGQLGGTVNDTLSTAVSGSLCCFIDFRSHNRFILRSIGQDIIPVSLKFKTSIKTPKVKEIIHWAERQL